MSLLQTPVLKALALKLEEENSGLKWVDLYAAEFVIRGLEESEEAFANPLALIVCQLSFLSRKGKLSVPIQNFDLSSGHSREYEFDASVLRQISLVDVIAPEVTREEVASISSKPIVLCGNDVYLSRFWNLKCQFDAWLSERLSIPWDTNVNILNSLGDELRSLFSLDIYKSEHELDWQAIACAHALIQNTTLIAGGPGTGKTTTAARLLFLVDQSFRLREGRPANVRLLAPTGKAAVRLVESIKSQLESIEGENPLRSQTDVPLSSVLPKSGETIHRFLIDHNALPSLRHRGDRVSAEKVFLGASEVKMTDADFLVIDESSMIDLALMVALIKIIPAKCRLVFMGDPFQLPPVEPGEVFTGLVKRFESEPYSQAFAEHISRLTGYDTRALTQSRDSSLGREGNDRILCYLRKTYRFGGDLKDAANYINEGNLEAFTNQYLVGHGEGDLSTGRDVRWFSLAFDGGLEPGLPSIVEKRVLSSHRAYFEAVSAEKDASALDEAFSEFQLLCSTHEGEQGVTAMNQLIEKNILGELGYKDVFDSERFLYHGKAILITKNHADLGVFNGDIGFVTKSGEKSGRYNVVFPQGLSEAIVVSPKRLKSWQPAYAMTVHKSQGSEYKKVGLLLADYAKELLSRPLIYTGLTRAKQTCDIWSTPESLETAFTSHS